MYNDDDDDEDDGMTFEEFMQGRFGRGYQGFSSGGFPDFFRSGNFGFYVPREMSPEEIRRRRKEREADEARRMEFLREQTRLRMMQQEMLAKAREAEKMAEEKKRAMEKERREKEERVRNEAIWASAQATTQDEKQALCFHSENWAKEKFQKKVKCEACGQKRGMVGHRCPHCSLLACQVCVNKFNEIRKAP